MRNPAAMPPKPHRLDLHGLGTAAAETAIRRLIATAQAQGVWRVEVVHGRGADDLAQVARNTLKAHPDVTDIGSLDANAGYGVWARLRKISAQPSGAGATSAAQSARHLLKQAKGLNIPSGTSGPPARDY